MKSLLCGTKEEPKQEVSCDKDIGQRQVMYVYTHSKHRHQH